MLKLKALSALTSLTLALQAEALTRDLNIVNKILAPDGFTRDFVLAEGEFPGPLLAIEEGERFQINVVNQLTNVSMLDTTSIHWHGIFQRNSSFYDGPAFVTQCPIVSGDSFLYDFAAPGQTGTYWYHSHLSTQYCDGLRGAMVIYDPPDDPIRELYDVDDDSTVLTLADWYHVPAPLLNGQPPARRVPASTLINGLGRWNDGTEVRGNLSVVAVEENTRYRMRLVSLSCAPSFTFSIDGHRLNIIEADGVAVSDLTVDSLVIHPGQRYSFVLTANQTPGNYWIRANPDTANSGFGGGINSAILRYAGVPEEEPTTQPTTGVILQESNLHPRTPSPPPAPDVDPIVIQATAANGINGVSFVEPPVPVLLQILSGVTDPAKLIPAASIIPLERDKTYELRITTTGIGHPFHLHGHNFYVIQSSGGQPNTVDPVIRDVVFISGAGAVIRFRTDNPGPWFLHCHIEFHLQAGMGVVLAEDIPGIPAANNYTEAWNQLCPRFNSSIPPLP